jgi:hypothetical protein
MVHYKMLSQTLLIGDEHFAYSRFESKMPATWRHLWEKILFSFNYRDFHCRRAVISMAVGPQKKYKNLIFECFSVGNSIQSAIRAQPVRRENLGQVIGLICRKEVFWAIGRVKRGSRGWWRN